MLKYLYFLFIVLNIIYLFIFLSQCISFVYGSLIILASGSIMKKSVVLLILILLLLPLELQSGETRLIFTGNNRGLLGPCACEIPAGGLARVAALSDSLGSSSMLVSAGNQLFSGMPGPGDDQIYEQQRAVTQAEILSMLQYQIINIGEFDLCYGIRFLQRLEEKFGLPFISANLRDSEGKRPFPSYRIIEDNDIKIAYIGICSGGNGFNFSIVDPLLELEFLLSENLFREADFVVLLADTPLEGLKIFLDQHDGIDFTVFSKQRYATPLPQKSLSGSRVHIGTQGQYTGSLTIVAKSEQGSWTNLSDEHYLFTLAQDAMQNENAADKLPKEQLKRQLNQTRRNFQRKTKRSHRYYYWELIPMTPDIHERSDILQMVRDFSLAGKQ